MSSVVQTPDEQRKDTSLPGREEEIIFNTEVQKQATNGEDGDKISPESGKQSVKATLLPDQENVSPGERVFKEGLADNSNTEETLT